MNEPHDALLSLAGLDERGLEALFAAKKARWQFVPGVDLGSGLEP